MRALALLLLAVCCGNPAAWARESSGVILIVSERAAVKALGRDEVASLFLGMSAGRSAIQGVTPVDSDDSELRELFYQTLLGRSRNQMRAYWSRMVFTGQGKPPRSLPPENIVRELAQRPDLVAYLRGDQKPPPGTRTLLVLP